MDSLNKIKFEFERIKDLGFVKSNRINNRDGGIGNTFEDYLGVSENNLRDPDFEGFEVKTQRQITSSYITLFSKSPSFPKGANAILKEKFGEVRDENFPDLKKLYASIKRFGTKEKIELPKIKILVKDNEWRWVMGGNGNHRAYIMSALKYPALPVSIIQVVDRSKSSQWNNVQNGNYTKREAEEIFDIVFRGDTRIRGCY